MAVEAARELSLVGQEARVILVETLVPGFPGFLRDWRIWAEAIGRQCKRLWTSEHPGLIRNLKIFGHRLGWSTVLTLRRLLHPVKNVPAIRWLLQWAQDGDYPVYKVRPLDAPCLHFLSADEPSSLDAIGAAARFGWKSYARSGIEEQYVAFDHHNVFHELNMPKMAEVLKRWCGAMGSQERTSNRKN